MLLYMLKRNLVGPLSDEHLQVAHPSRRCCDRDGLGTDGKVEDLRWEDPADGGFGESDA